MSFYRLLEWLVGGLVGWWVVLSVGGWQMLAILGSSGTVMFPGLLSWCRSMSCYRLLEWLVGGLVGWWVGGLVGWLVGGFVSWWVTDAAILGSSGTCPLASALVSFYVMLSLA